MTVASALFRGIVRSPRNGTGAGIRGGVTVGLVPDLTRPVWVPGPAPALAHGAGRAAAGPRAGPGRPVAEKLRSEPNSEELRKIRIRLLKEINTRELDLYRQKAERFPTETAHRLAIDEGLADLGLRLPAVLRKRRDALV